jgi:hypothetical protein
MSIPHASDQKKWALFALSHFKPFGFGVPLLHEDEDVLVAYENYAFLPRSHEIMGNWESVHECEDARNAERLRKHAQMSTESKALTSSLALSGDDNNFDISLPINS